jgi:hypothetical protein
MDTIRDGLHSDLIPESSPLHPKHQDYLRLREKLQGCWDELASLINLHDKVLLKELAKYRLGTLGSSC